MKTRIIIWVVIIVLLGLAIWLFMRPSAKDKNGSKNELTITQASILNPNAEFPMKKIITSEAEYQETFENATSGMDFTKYNMAIICLGKANTGGFSVEITSITKEKDKVLVHVKDISPGKNCILTQVINYPFSAVYFEKTELPIEWDLKSIIEDCP